MSIPALAEVLSLVLDTLEEFAPAGALFFPFLLGQLAGFGLGAFGTDAANTRYALVGLAALDC